MELKIAVVTAVTYKGKNEKEVNIKRALKYIDEASEKGAKIICFPESFPGPWSDDNMYSPVEELAKKAAERKVYVICGTLELVQKKPEHYYNTEVLIGSRGQIIGKYRRTTPHGPWMYKGGPLWNYNYEVGNDLPVFNTEYCKIGILVCSEVYTPELARILSLKGAEIIFMPMGATRPKLWETWITLLKARAYENLAITAASRNVFGTEDGLAIITGPEKTLLQSVEPGVHVAVVDLERLRWLRNTEDKWNNVLPYSVKPGLLTQWRRPELYEEIVKVIRLKE